MTRAVALLLTVATGFSGLAYEVTWEKFLAILLGSHSEATAAVLGIFLGGLSLGYALFGRLVRRVVSQAAQQGRAPRLLLLYGAVEAAIGVYVLLFPLFFELAQSLSLRFPLGFPVLAFGFDVVLTALLIGPPTLLMGGTIPILTQALARSVEDATRLHAMVYGFNTAGAFIGALAAGFFLIPRLGLVGVMLAMGSINLLAGAIFAALGTRQADAPVPDDGAQPTAERIQGFGWFAATALLLGFAMMSVQTVSIRLGGLALGSTQFTFSMVVAVFVLCIALGSMAVSALPRVPRWLLASTLWALVLILYGLYALLPRSLYWAHVLRTLFTAQDAAFLPYHAAVFLGLLALLGAPVLLSGAVLPLIFDQLKGASAQLGSSAGRLYSWNTLGSLLGALLGGYALLFWLDLHHVYRLAVAVLATAAALVTLRLYSLSIPLAALLLAPVMAAIFVQGAWQPELLSSGLFRERRAKVFTYRGLEAFLEEQRLRRDVIFYDDDPTVSVAVVDQLRLGGARPPRALLSNGKPDGSTQGDYTTMALAALLPAVLMDAPERAFVIGYGTGVTVGELAMLESTREVVVAEISAGVTAAAPLFDFANGGASKHPDVQILRSDAYRALRRSEGDYDIIVSEPSNPWMAGVEMLYSREFLQLARARLRPGGIYVQWLQQYESDVTVLTLVLHTYASVFDHVAVWYSQGSDLLLLGIEDPEPALDIDRIERRVLRPDVSAGLARAGVTGLAPLLAHELLPQGVVGAMSWAGPLHTLRHPLLSFLAGRAFYRGFGSVLPFSGARAPAEVGARNSLLRRLAQRSEGVLPDDLRSAALSEACRYRTRLCAAMLSQWLAEEPGSGAARAALRDALGRHPRRFGGSLDASTVRALASLFSASSDPLPTAGMSPAAATQRTRLYRSYYRHTAPFDAQRLPAPGGARVSERRRD